MFLNNAIVLNIRKNIMFQSKDSSLKTFLKFIKDLQMSLEVNFENNEGFKVYSNEFYKKDSDKPEDDPKQSNNVKVYVVFKTKTEIEKWERPLGLVKVGKTTLPIETIFDKNLQKIVLDYYTGYVSILETQSEEGIDALIDEKLHDMRIKLNYIQNYFKIQNLLFNGKLINAWYFFRARK